MRVAVLYTPAGPDAPPEDLDGVVQMEAVSAALTDLGHQAVPVGFELNMEAVRLALQTAAPDVVFNMVESVGGYDRLLHLGPALLEALAIPFTGAGVTSTLLTTNKLAAKRTMHYLGLPTPDWIEPHGISPSPAPVGDRVITKSAWDHGSRGLDDDAITFLDDEATHLEKLRRLSARAGDVWFCERFTAGREFNISVLASPEGPVVLPHAEILFEGFDEDRPNIVGYQAKWDETSHDYGHTPRCFDFGPEDRPLLDHLSDLSLRCWRAFDVRGFARVDFRVNRAGQPFILEINVNPCISPDAGFAAAVERAGLSYNEAVARILADM